MFKNVIALWFWQVIIHYLFGIKPSDKVKLFYLQCIIHNIVHRLRIKSVNGEAMWSL